MDIRFINLKDVDYSLQLEVRDWRNSPDIAKYFQIDHIDLETHKNWLDSLKEENPKNIAFLIEVNNDFIGLVYFTKINYLKKVADWGIYIRDLNYRKKGIGSLSIDWCNQYIKSLGIKEVFLEVLTKNKNAISAYEKKGYLFHSMKNKDVKRYKITL